MDDLHITLPRSRTQDLLTEIVDDEIVLYDLRNNRAYHLNRIASSVWQSCDGTTSLAELLSSLEQQLARPVDPDMVRYALRQFERHHLLDEAPRLSVSHVTRREMIKHLGVAMLPAIAVLAAPLPMQATSNPGKCQELGENCNGNKDCCPGLECVEIHGGKKICTPIPLPTSTP